VRSQANSTGQTTGSAAAVRSSIINFPQIMAALHDRYRPSRMPFFGHLAALSRPVARDPSLLGQIHLIYQSAMHATRAAVYLLPHLDSPGLRKRKLQIFIDDDGLPGGDTHHYQLTRAFESIGAKCRLSDEEFGEPELLSRHLEAETAHFVRLAPKLYSRSLGPWCAIEALSLDWMRALADSLAVQFPEFKNQPYFADCFSQEVEERHAAEAIEVTQSVLRVRPELLRVTLRDARIIARALDGVWTHLDRIVQTASDKSPPRRGRRGKSDGSTR
jgi:pyrroloquinoline quinone (PQQ) biosynthesis protein C